MTAGIEVTAAQVRPLINGGSGAAEPRAGRSHHTRRVVHFEVAEHPEHADLFWALAVRLRVLKDGLVFSAPSIHFLNRFLSCIATIQTITKFVACWIHDCIKLIVVPLI